MNAEALTTSGLGTSERRLDHLKVYPFRKGTRADAPYVLQIVIEQVYLVLPGRLKKRRIA
jgi:hypothetical protein